MTAAAPAVVPAPAPADLDTPLPAEIVGSSQGWFTRYRAYPVFSRPWVSGRQRVLGSMLAMALLSTGGPLLLKEGEDLPWGGIVHISVQLALPLLLGPWLGWLVRRRGWPARREWLALVAVVAGVIMTMLVFHAMLAEPVKQAIAQATGQVDEKGQRKRIMLSVGMMISRPGEPPPPPLAEPGPLPPEVKIMNTLTSVFLSFALAGGFALWGWRREQAGLAALAQARALQQALASRREAELRLSVLAAQVEPHFLFNTLAGVRSAITSDPQRASEMVDRLVDYLRAAIPRLRADGGAQATLGDQIEIVRAYLGLMASRMPRLSYEIAAPPELLAAPFPPLMLISLAENAVKHGAEPKMGPVRITVAARLAVDGRLAVTVADNGAGFGASAGGSGLGLANIRERLQQMYQGRAGLALKAGAAGGVEATLSLPLE
ncbi:Autolysin sensor kinase [Rubrivivax sp. A210]|uniref:sensor histidine kinase n=1 Tax=Rubrivivax sp. A210 TaxID=2772301 RepID=UPI001917DAF6|nr:histidine kinase [Rubrivivax sp. A210]CAD5374870.1 Autolysin sensor kinase [Rubrivivax sp. A210]